MARFPLTKPTAFASTPASACAVLPREKPSARATAPTATSSEARRRQPAPRAEAVVPDDGAGGFLELVLAPGVGGGRVGRPQRRELRRQAVDVELVDALRAVEVLEPVLAEVADAQPRQLVVLEHGRGRLREQHLAAVAGRHDARRAVHAQPVVPLLADRRLAGV